MGLGRSSPGRVILPYGRITGRRQSENKNYISPQHPSINSDLIVQFGQVHSFDSSGHSLYHLYLYFYYYYYYYSQLIVIDTDRSVIYHLSLPSAPVSFLCLYTRSTNLRTKTHPFLFLSVPTIDFSFWLCGFLPSAGIQNLPVALRNLSRYPSNSSCC